MRKRAGVTLTPKGWAVASLLLADPSLDINRALELVELESIGKEPAPACGTIMEGANG